MRPTVDFIRDDVTVTVNAPFATRRNGGAELEFRGLSSTERESLATFFKEQACGRQFVFTYKDERGVSYSSRFVDGHLVFVQFSRNAWDCTLSLDLGAK